MSLALKFVTIDQLYLARQMRQYLRLAIKYSTPKKLLNMAKVEYELLMKKNVLSSMPYCAKLEPTNICNLDCTFCYRKEVKYGFGSTKFEDFKKTFDQLRDYLCISVLHHLGEPLLHKDICKIINYVHKNRVATYVSTNLNYLTDELAEELVKSGLDVLSVSIDGITQESYSEYRRQGELNLLIKNLKKLIAVKRRLKSSTPYIDFQFIIFKYNENQIEDVRRIAKQLGVDSLKLRPGIIDDPAWLPENKNLRSKLYVNRRKKKKACWWLWRTTHVTWNGNVIPCCRVICDKPYGNVRQQKFIEIWNNKDFVESRKVFTNNGKRPTQCTSCEIPYGNIHG